MVAGLGVGLELYCGVRCADRRLPCPFPVFPLEEVIGQESPGPVNALGKNGCHRFPDSLIKKLARWSQKRLIGNLPGQSLGLPPRLPYTERQVLKEWLLLVMC
jgi:hypothetical protein